MQEEKYQRSKIWMLRIAIGFAIVSYVGIYGLIRTTDFCPTTPYLRDTGSPEAPVSYNEILSRFPLEDSSPGTYCLGFITLNVLAIVIISFFKYKHILVLFVLAEILFIMISCGYLYVQYMQLIFVCRWTDLEHIQTVDFDSRIFHLAVAHYHQGEPGSEGWTIYFFECDDQSSERCVGQFLSDYDFDTDKKYYDTFKRPKTRLLIDENAHELHVFAENKVIFTVDARSN